MWAEDEYVYVYMDMYNDEDIWADVDEYADDCRLVDEGLVKDLKIKYKEMLEDER